MGGIQDTCSPRPLRKIAARYNGLSVSAKPPMLTERQKTLLRSSWKATEMDITKVGIITFVGLFEAHPDFKESFGLLRGLSHSEMRHSVILRDHALRVMGIVEKCINRLDDPEKLESIMVSLGKRHVNYSARKQLVDLIGPQFISSLKQLQDEWTEEYSEAWTALFKQMTFHMKSTMPD